MLPFTRDVLWHGADAACCPQPCLLWQSSQPLGRGAASLTQLPVLPSAGASLACGDLPSEDQDGDQDVSAAP